MTYLYPIWLFFAALFFYFSYIHWRQSSEDIRPFQFRERGPKPVPQRADPESGNPNADFVFEFNHYLETANAHSRSRHRAAAMGYFVAGLTAMSSMFLLLFT